MKKISLKECLIKLTLPPFHDTNIRHEERMLSKLEDELDETCTTAAQALDKLISAQKVACTAYKTAGLKNSYQLQNK